MAEPGKVLIIAPYWCDPQHLGSYRADRFVRWLGGAGARIVLVAGGADNGLREGKWGTLVTVRDPLGIYCERRAQACNPPARNRLLRLLAYLLLSPDPGILWAWRASRNPLVLEHGAGAALVLSSSFPESAHVAAARLATLLGAKLAVDLRDGWLDEPMKPLLRQSLLRRRREGLLERRILRQAGTIFVTSPQWRHLLSRRLPFTADKIVTLTNAYPLECRSEAAGMNRPQQPFTLLYAGRLSTSRAERRIEHLLQPLLTGLQAIDQGGRLLFVGNLGQSELDALKSWRNVFMQAGWDLAVRAAVPRSTALELMRTAHGLLLLSSSHASIPAKLFDYLCARRPILALAPPSSAVAELAAQLPQLLVLDYRDAGAAKSTVDKFIRVCGDMPSYDLPPQFGEAHLRTVFLTALEYLEKEAT